MSSTRKSTASQSRATTSILTRIKTESSNYGDGDELARFMAISQSDDPPTYKATRGYA